MNLLVGVNLGHVYTLRLTVLSSKTVELVSNQSLYDFMTIFNIKSWIKSMIGKNPLNGWYNVAYFDWSI